MVLPHCLLRTWSPSFSLCSGSSVGTAPSEGTCSLPSDTGLEKGSSFRLPPPLPCCLILREKQAEEKCLQPSADVL